MIGNAQGFWGDSVDAPARLVSQQPNLDYLTLDYLAELSMSILAVQKERDPAAGYAYSGTDTAPGAILTAALGNGSNPPTRGGAVTLNS